MDEIIINGINSRGVGIYGELKSEIKINQSKIRSEIQKDTSSASGFSQKSDIKSEISQKSQLRSYKDTPQGQGEDTSGQESSIKFKNATSPKLSPKQTSQFGQDSSPKLSSKQTSQFGQESSMRMQSKQTSQQPKESKFVIQKSLDQQLKFQNQLASKIQFHVDTEEQIFKRILEKKETEMFQKSECQVLCTNKPKIQCCFCGKWVCSSHCTKQRKNPQQQEKYYDICNTCEDKYLKKAIYLDYQEKICLYENFCEIYEQEYGQKSEIIRQKMEERVLLSELIKTEQEENILSQNNLTSQIYDIKQEIQDTEEQYYILLDKELEDVQRELNLFDLDYMKLQNQTSNIKENNAKTVDEIQNMLEENQEKEYIVNFLNQELKNIKIESKVEEIKKDE